MFDNGTLVLALSTLAACTDLVSLPEREPTIAGEIVALGVGQLGVPVSAVERRVHVRAPGDRCGIIFSVHEETVIGLTRTLALPRPGTFVDLAVGQSVLAWAQGAISRSCPGTADAAALEVLLDADVVR